nr:hypothetical protein [Tanacetum cinerariifolium]
EEKSRSARIKVAVKMVVSAGDGVVSCRREVIIDIVRGMVVACAVEVSGIAVSGTLKSDGA